MGPLAVVVALSACSASSPDPSPSFRSGEWTSSGNGTTYGGTTHGYEGSTGDGTTYGYTTGDGYGSTHGYGGTTYGYGSTSTITTDATSGASPTSSTTDGGQWYAIPAGSIDEGFDSAITDNPLCSGAVDNVWSECLDELTLKYPDHDECTETLSEAQVNCKTWCQDQDHEDGECIVEEEAADHCECTMFRQQLGIEIDKPGCVATYPVGDDQCAETPRDYALSTCKYAEGDDDGEPRVLVNKVTSEEGCAQSDIEDEEINCGSWCQQNHSLEGVCTTEYSETCGGNHAARCVCGEPQYTNSSGFGNLASCQQRFEKPGTCADDGTPETKGSTCYQDTINHFPAVGCTGRQAYLDGDNVENIDCNQWCKDEGHSGGTCELDQIEVTCPSGDTTQSAQCVCS